MELPSCQAFRTPFSLYRPCLSQQEVLHSLILCPGHVTWSPLHAHQWPQGEAEADSHWYQQEEEEGGVQQEGGVPWEGGVPQEGRVSKGEEVWLHGMVEGHEVWSPA